MSTKVENMKTYLSERLQECRSIQQRLACDNLPDEALLPMIQGNIFDVFTTIFNLGLRICKNDDERMHSFFLSRWEQITSEWREALKGYEMSQDTENANIERLKLTTALEIKSIFVSLWEEENA